MARLEIHKGRDKAFSLTVKDQDGNPVNLTGSTIRFTVKEFLTDTDANAKISKYSGEGISIDNGPLGMCTVSIIPTDTQTLAVKDYYWDLQVIVSGKEYSSEPDEFEVKAVVRTD